MIISHLKLDALVAGIVSIFIVLVLHILAMILILSLLSGLVSSDILYTMLRILGIFCLAIPPYVAARVAFNNALLHSLIIGLVQSLLILMMMTQNFSWQGTLQYSVVGKMSFVIGAMLLLSLISGIIARWMNQKDKT